MDDSLQWFVGITVSAFSALSIALMGAFRNLASRTSIGDRDLHKRIEAIQEKYVRRDDLQHHLTRVDGSIKELREEMRENHKALLSAIRPR